ncbi:rhodanese-like domain-containing protein [Hymenobacter tenuis]
MKRSTSLLLGLLLTTALTACGQQKTDAPQTPAMSAYDQMLRVLYKQTVPVVQPAALAHDLQQSPQQVLLLDTRSRAEFGVSHLRGARFIDYDHFRDTDLRQISRTQPIVVYCTVGARSEQVGTWLQEQGFRNVRNLYGGIFQWVNDGLGVVNAQGPTTKVHPYSVLWRPWLKQGVASYE